MNPFDAGTAEHDEYERQEDDQRAAAFAGDVLAELYRQRVRREATRRLDVEARPAAPPPAILTLRERLARPRPEVTWRIDGWQPSDARVVLAAQYKAGKTTLTGNLVRSLIDGDLWLGKHQVTPIDGTLGLLDFEMSDRQLDDWLRDQQIRGDDRIYPISLRGKAAAFDIIDPDIRASWARQLRSRGVTYLVWDPLRPVIDALGLDEQREAGRLLTAFDALLEEAGITEALIAHHMGHTGERSRGDSRIRDWPDVEWRLIRQDDDPSSPRYVTAFGRDVDVPEALLDYSPAGRRLELVGGSRNEAALRDALDDVLKLLKDKPDLSGRAIEDEVWAATGHKRAMIRAALKQGVRDKVIVAVPGPKRAVLHSLPPPELF